MWGFELLPVSGGAPVPVPPGDTVLGRGPLLGVSDKRVSRTHALLQNCDGELRLKSTHVNPVFVQTSSESSPSPLTRDQWRVLQPGDTVSLLPGQLCYKVLKKTDRGPDRGPDRGQDQDLNPDVTQGTDQSNGHVSGEGPVDTQRTSSPIGLDRTQTPPPQRTDQSHKQKDDHRREKAPDHTLSSPRTRVLPAWMMSAPQTSLTSSPRTAVKKGKTSSSTPKQTTPPVMSSSEGAGQSEKEEEQRPKKRRKQSVLALSPDPGPDPGLGADSGPVEAAAKVSTSAPKRQACPYGKDCYRKNPLHFQEQSHPGDLDYEDPDQDQDSDLDSERPECPYGTDCYRKNPQHRKEFSHKRRPVRRSRPSVSKGGGDDEEEDEEDEYESSFIDSGSDYEPPKEQSSSESEDLSRLQEEARDLLRGRR